MSDTNLDLHPIEKPLVIDAIKCRIRQDAKEFSGVYVLSGEAVFICDILDAARLCLREWAPTETDKARGHGTGVGQRAAEDRLIAILKREP